MDTNLNEQKEPNKSESKRSGFLNLKYIIPVIIAAFLLTATFGIVMAKKKFADGPGGFMMGMLVEKLDLNATQKAQVEKIKDEIHSRMQTKVNENQTMKDDLASEFAKENMDKNKLMEFHQKRQQEMDQNSEFMMDKMIEFHNLLTPEQRQQAVDLMKNMKGGFNQGMGNRSDCPNCGNCPNGKNGKNGPNGPNGKNRYDDSDGSKWKNYKEN